MGGGGANVCREPAGNNNNYWYGLQCRLFVIKALQSARRVRTRIFLNLG